MEEQKAKIVLELDRECFQTAFFLLKEKFTDEMWQKVSSEPITVDTDDIGEEAIQMKLAFACYAVAKVLGKTFN